MSRGRGISDGVRADRLMDGMSSDGCGQHREEGLGLHAGKEDEERDGLNGGVGCQTAGSSDEFRKKCSDSRARP